MEAELVWKVLGISPTKDEKILKDQYHSLLRYVNPEDDPEGFKQLRQAYEMAVKLAAETEEETTGQKEKDDIDLWLDRVNQVYWYISTRNDKKLWKELLQDEVCLALDTSFEARERFLVFMMSHVYVDQDIWKMIDHEFCLMEDMEILKEKFSKDFLEYVQYQIMNPNFFPYDLLEVLALDESEVKLDDYIIAYLRCKADMDHENYEDMWQKLDALKTHDVYHPYEDVERVRLYLVEHKASDACKLAEKLLEAYPDDVYIGYWTGRAYWNMEQWETAYQCWKHVTDLLPDHYSSRVGLAEYYLKTEDYIKARELIMELLEINGRDEYTLDLMRKANQPLIRYYKEKAGQEEYKKNMVEACWCMFQNELFTETLEELEQLHIHPEDEEYYDYVNMRGRCYLGLERYEEAVEYLLKWEEARENLMDDGSEKCRKRMSREGFIKSAIGVCYQNLKKFELAEQYLSEGIQKEQDKMIRLSFMDRLALLYYEFGYYEKCIDECTAILEEDSVYYPAYLRRQQAAFELQDGQQVIDDYYNAVRIYPSYYKPYLLAVQVFCIYHQYEDARKVLKLAQEQEVHQELLSFFEIRVMRHLARTEEESRSVLELCHNLQKELAQKEEEHAILKKDSDKTEVELLDDDMKRDGMPKDVVNEEELQFEEILLYMDSNQTDRALQVTDAVIQQGSQNVRFRWVRADIYRIRKEYRKALSEYDDLKKEVAASSEIEFNRGICLQKLGKVQEAILAFRTTLELNPKHPRAHHELMKIYSQMYDRYELKTAYGNALKEITAQLELVPDAYYYIERGLLYMDNYNFEPARKDYEKALELEPDNIYAYNNIGYVYQAQKEFQKALQYYEKSMECMKEERTMLPYTNAAKCYEALRQWDQAVDVLMKALEVFGPSRSIYSQLVKIYTCKRDTAMVTQWCEKAVQQKLMSKPDYYDKLSRIYFVTGRLEEGKKILTLWNNWVEAHWDNNHPRWQYMCDVSEAWGVYYRYHRELKRAIRYLENAWKIERKHGLSYIRTGIHLSNAYYASKQWKKAYAVAKETMNYMITSNHIPLKLKEAEPENPETIQSYLSYRPLAPLRMFEAAQLYISMGELDKAERLLHQCQQVPRCRHCEFGECCDGRMIQAFLEELKGNEKEAIRLYEIAQQIDPSDIEPALALDALRNKKGG